MSFDFVADTMSGDLAALQAAGEVIAVRLPAGFYGVCLIVVCSRWREQLNSGR